MSLTYPPSHADLQEQDSSSSMAKPAPPVDSGEHSAREMCRPIRHFSQRECWMVGAWRPAVQACAFPLAAVPGEAGVSVFTPQTGHNAHTHSLSGTTVRFAHSRGPLGPSLGFAGGGAGLRARPTVSRIRGSAADLLLEAGDLLADGLRVMHHRCSHSHSEGPSGCWRRSS